MANIAIDVGSGITKVMRDDTRVSFRSIAGIAPDNDGDGLNIEKQLGFRVSFDKKTYLVGEAAENGVHPNERVNTRTDSWFEEPEYLALMYAAISCVLQPRDKPKDQKGRIRLCTGLPQALVGLHKEELIKRLSRKYHNFTVDGKHYKFRLKATDIVVLPQPAGLYISELARDKSLRERGVTVIDVGTYTTDWCTYNKQQSQNFGTNGISVGMADLANMLIEKILVQEDREISFEEATEAVRRGRLAKGEGWIDVKGMVRPMVDRFARKISAKMQDDWEGSKHNLVIVGGGGGPVFLESLKSHFPYAKIACETEPFYSIANGYKLWLERPVANKAA